MYFVTPRDSLGGRLLQAAVNQAVKAESIDGRGYVVTHLCPFYSSGGTVWHFLNELNHQASRLPADGSLPEAEAFGTEFVKTCDSERIKSLLIFRDDSEMRIYGSPGRDAYTSLVAVARFGEIPADNLKKVARSCTLVSAGSR